jgi:hypothetical protein
MADYSAIRTYFDSHKLKYFTFYVKSVKPIKAVTGICLLTLQQKIYPMA